MLCASAQQFRDWTAAYRLFAKERIDRAAVFAPARQAVIEQLEDDEPLTVLMAAYTYLLLAASKVKGGYLPLAKWRQSEPPQRTSTQMMQNLFRSQLWNIAVARKLMGMGLPIEAIMTATNLTREEVESLRS